MGELILTGVHSTQCSAHDKLHVRRVSGVRNDIAEHVPSSAVVRQLIGILLFGQVSSCLLVMNSTHQEIL